MLVLIGAIGGTANGGKPNTAASPADTSTYDPPPIASSAPAAETTTETATAAPPAPPKPRTLLQLTGSGIRTTKPFTAPDQWTLAYSFDCSNFGLPGNFAVTLYDGSDPVDLLVNELAKSGKANTEAYQSGQLHLEINSECNWSVRVIG